MTTTPQLCVVQLRDGDTLASLAKEWGLSGSPAAGAAEICAWNGVAFAKGAIDRWVMSNGGRRLPFVESDPYDAATRTGWAVFTSQSRILMPTGKRMCVVPGGKTDSKPTSPVVVVGALGLLGVAFWAFTSSK